MRHRLTIAALLLALAASAGAADGDAPTPAEAENVRKAMALLAASPPEPASLPTPRPVTPAPAPPPAELPAAPPPLPLPMPPNPGSCATCGGGGLLGGGGNCDSCAGGGCVPGKEGCQPCVGDTAFERALCLVYHCVCCPDPCYKPKWTTLANAAFFVDGVRPITQSRFQWRAGRNVTLPDRAEYFWARSDGRGRGLQPVFPYAGPLTVRYDELRVVNETSTGTAGVWIDTPYRSMEVVGASPASAANFSDISIGAKSVLYDSELFQLGFQTTTYIPAGNPRKGMGTGHASLEPSLIVGVKLGPETFLQGQIGEWIPLGGDRDYEGAILNYHLSVNQVLMRPVSDLLLIGTCEFSGYSFQDGLLTDPLVGPAKASGETYAYFGAGMRLSFCEKMDVGFAARVPLTADHLEREQYRMEFRYRY